MVSRYALQALISLGIVAAALMLTDGQPSYAQGDEGCHFLMHLRKPIEFTGPAGGADFVLYQETKYKANIYLSNIYGDQPCNWQASTNQNWLDLSRTSGQIAGDDDTFITVSINGRAQDLPRGVHKAEVVLKSSQGSGTQIPVESRGDRVRADSLRPASVRWDVQSQGGCRAAYRDTRALPTSPTLATPRVTGKPTATGRGLP